MLPVTHGVEYTRWQILFYTVLLVLVTLLPYIAGMSGVFYLGGALVLGGGVPVLRGPADATRRRKCSR